MQSETCRVSNLPSGYVPGADLRITLRTDPRNWLRTGRCDQLRIHDKISGTTKYTKVGRIDLAQHFEVSFGGVSRRAVFVI